MAGVAGLARAPRRAVDRGRDHRPGPLRICRDLPVRSELRPCPGRLWRRVRCWFPSAGAWSSTSFAPTATTSSARRSASSASLSSCTRRAPPSLCVRCRGGVTAAPWGLIASWPAPPAASPVGPARRRTACSCHVTHTSPPSAVASSESRRSRTGSPRGWTRPAGAVPPTGAEIVEGAIPLARTWQHPLWTAKGSGVRDPMDRQTEPGIQHGVGKRRRLSGRDRPRPRVPCSRGVPRQDGQVIATPYGLVPVATVATTWRVRASTTDSRLAPWSVT